MNHTLETKETALQNASFSADKCHGREFVSSYCDLPYGTHERHILDLFLPENCKAPHSLILFVHGGGWINGDKSAHTEDARFRAEQGYMAATMNYRYVSHDIHIPHILDDITSALGFIKQFCGQKGFSLHKVILSGGSAGGHLCLLYAYTRREESPLLPVATVCHCPAADFTDPAFLIGREHQFEDWKYEVLSECTGLALTKENFFSAENQKVLRTHSPAFYLAKDCPPAIFAQGRFDEIVPYQATLRLFERYQAFGIPCDFVTYETSGHALENDPEAKEKASVLFTQYAEKYLD